MSTIDALLVRLAEFGAAEALVCRGKVCRFDELNSAIARESAALVAFGVRAGDVVAIDGDYSTLAVAALLAVLANRGIAVPLTPTVAGKKAEYFATAEVQWILTVDENRTTLRATRRTASHPLLGRLKEERHPGLVLFTSGSTGESKGVVHDAERLLKKYLVPRHCYRTLAFLLFDHIGGLDTLFYSLANGSCLATVSDRSPDAICAAVEAHRIEVLPVSPSFLNLLLLDGAHLRHDLSSLKIITYGAEVMPESTLQRVSRTFPGVRLLQKFGTTEIGTLRSHSRASDSTWVRIGGEGYQTRIVEGMLQIKAEAAMLGYLNAPSPFTEDGWFITGDKVEADGEYFRILGRESDIINVGGQKVFPAEVEAALLQIENVRDAVVYGRPNPLTGQSVAARIELDRPEELPTLRQRVRQACLQCLAPYKVPSFIEIVEGPLHGARMKKIRRSDSV